MSVEVKLAEISTKLDAIQSTQTDTNQTLKAFDERLRKVETRSMVNAAITALLISMGTALGASWFKKAGGGA